MTGKKKGALYEHLNYRMGDFVLVGNQGVTFRCSTFVMTCKSVIYNVV